MAAAFFLYLWQSTKFTGRLFVAIPQAGWRRLPLRLMLFVAVWLAYVLITGLHWLGFACDELFFRRYRTIAIRKPLMVLGIPRSGTTWLQRVLARDPNLSSLTLWEALLAPSISQRWLARRLAPVGRPIAALLKRLPLTGAMDAIHEIRLTEPEEDFLLLLPLQACFLGVFLCPRSQRYWQLADFDRQIGPRERKIIMRFYRRCLQKHLYVHGEHLTILSKNPSFTPFIRSLREAFPDACMIACIRPPEEAVPSQLSSVGPALTLLGQALPEPEFHARMLSLLHRYYEILGAESDSIALLGMDALREDLQHSVKKLYQRFAMVMPAEFEEALLALSQRGQNYRSAHTYELLQFGLSPASIAQTYADCWPIALAEE